MNRDQSPSPNGSVAPEGNSARGEEALRAAIDEAGLFARRYLFGLCGDWDQAEDLAQEAMLKAWAKRASFDGRSNVRTWLFAIVRNHWLDSLRRKKTAAVMETIPEEILVARGTYEPAGRAQRNELADAINTALGKLPAEQREALALRESEGLTFPQIAELTNVPVATVKSRVRYALLKLAEHLQAHRGDVS